MNDYDEIWDKRGERAYGAFTRHPILVTIGSILAIVVLVGVLGFAIGWFNKAAEVAGPGNVSAQYQEVIGDWNAMQQAAVNACGAADSAKNTADPTLLEDPAFAYKAQYRHIAVDFNRRQQNIFEAKAVGPSGYPSTAPSLEAMQKQVC